MQNRRLADEVRSGRRESDRQTGSAVATPPDGGRLNTHRTARHSGSSPHRPVRHLANVRDRLVDVAGSAPLQAALVAAVLFALTLQTHINGSEDPYATDVGEFQNALPRWGTLHFTGYPLYAMTGSTIVTFLRQLGVEPAAGASVVSMVWAVLAVALTARLARELGSRHEPAVLGSLAFAIATSMWVDASVAEVHSLTLAFTVASLLFAVRYDRDGNRSDLLALVFVFSQGVMHMRAVLFLAPAIAVLVWPRWMAIASRWKSVLAIAALSPLPYLYMPLREWMGATWTFGQTRTWRGFWTMILDTKAERIVHLPTTAAELAMRARQTFALLGSDLPSPLLAIGLVAIAAIACDRSAATTVNRRISLGLTLAWLPYAALCMIIWEGGTSDALLAVKLPVALMAGVGLALATSRLAVGSRRVGHVALVALAAAVAFSAWRHYPTVAAITRDRSIETTIATGMQAANPGRPLTLVAPWGHTYWALAYAQEYRGGLPGVQLVDHNAHFAAIVRGGSALVVLADTLYIQPLEWWTERLGPLYPETYAPGLIELCTSPRQAEPGTPKIRINDDLAIVSATTHAKPDGAIIVDVSWLALRPPVRDYSVGIHLVATSAPDDPPLATADVASPVAGWHPTSQWQAGQVVRDAYLLTVPSGAPEHLVRVTAYYQDESGQFVTGSWLSLPAP